MSQKITNGPLTIIADDPFEVWRAETAFTKEPGTIRFLDGLKPGDVFYDIGANIGIYTILAAQRVGPTGKVYAFEPHVANAASLIRNIKANSVQDRVTLVTCALSGIDDFGFFLYASSRAGSSGHQFRSPGDVQPRPEAVREWKCARTFDSLQLWRPSLKPSRRSQSSRIKIDVDGNELSILQGMTEALGSGVSAIQVEIDATFKSTASLIHELLCRRGYSFAVRHDTMQGQQAIDEGADPATITHNAVFERVAVPA